MRTALIAVLFSGAAAHAAGQVDPQFQAARVELRKGHYAAAEALLKKSDSPLSKAIRARLIYQDRPDLRRFGITHFNRPEAERLLREALPALRTLARTEGDAASVLGDLTMDGVGVPQDDAEAIKLFEAARKLGNPSASLRLGLCYVSGRGAAKDEVKGISLVREAADKGHPEAMKFMYQAFSEGVGVRPDLFEAFAYLKKAVDVGEPEARFAYAELYRKFAYEPGSGMMPQSIQPVIDRQYDLFEAAAQDGDALAMVQCSIMCSANPPTKIPKAKVPSVSFEWSKKASESGLPQGLTSLASHYKVGIGCTKSQEMAEALYKRAKEAAKGNEELLRLIDATTNVKPFDGKAAVQGDAEDFVFDRADEAETAKPKPKRNAPRMAPGPPPGTVLLVTDLVENQREGSAYVTVSGRATNLSGRSLQNVQVEIEFLDSAGRLISSDKGMVEPNPVAASGVARFSVFAKDPGLHARTRATFSLIGGEELPSFDSSRR